MKKVTVLVSLVFSFVTLRAQNVGIGTTSPASKLEVNGPIATAIQTVSSNTTIDGTYSTVLASPGITVTLPAVATAAKRVYTIVYNASSGAAVTVKANGSEFISNSGNLSNTYSLTAGSIILQSNGTYWYATTSATTTGTVTGVTATSPLSVTGTTTPNVSLTGTVPIANGGTGLTAVGAGQILIGTSTGGFLNTTLTGTTNQVNVASSSGAITLSTPQDIATTSNVTHNTLTATAANANSIVATGSIKMGTTTATAATAGAGALVWSTPNVMYSDGTTWKTLSAGGTVTNVTASSPISVSNGTTTPAISLGVVPIANGGTNSSTALNNNRVMVSSGGAIVEGPALTNGQLLIGSTGAAPVAGSITAGTGITVTPSAGGITITNSSPSSGGTVTSVTASNGLTSSGGNTPNITLGGTLTGATTITDATAGNNLTINSSVAASTTTGAETVGHLVINRANAGGTGGQLTIRNSGGASVLNSSAVIAFETDGSTAFGADGSNQSNAEIRAVNTAAGNGASLLFSNWSGSAENERMRITDAGNVGIGSTNPGQKLTVVDAGNSNAYSGTLNVYPQNLTQGIGIGYGGVSALAGSLALNSSGANALNIQNVGTGVVNIGAAGGAGVTSLNVTGYTVSNYFNSPDNVVGSGVTGILVKAGDNYHRTANAAAVLSFLGVTAPTGDNLGNHTATTTLNMNGNSITNAPYYNVTPGNNYGLQFWSSGSYAIKMGNTGEYQYGPVTDYSIKMCMDGTAGRGWTFGVNGATPVAAIGQNGNMQISGNMYFGNYLLGNSKYVVDATDSWLRLNQQNSFSSGTYTPYFLRTDGGFASGGIGGLGGGTVHASSTIRGGGFQDYSSGQQVIDAGGGWHRSYGQAGWYNGTYGGGWWMQDGSWVRSYNNIAILATGGIAGYGNQNFGSPYGTSPRMYANYDNLTSGGISVSDDGGWYDFNDAWITYRGSTGIKVSSNTTGGASAGSALCQFSMVDQNGANLTDKQVGPSNADWGYLGTSGTYWYYGYAGAGWVTTSQRSFKRNITPLSHNMYSHVMNDIDRIKPSFYKLKDETDELVENKESKYRANYHLGVILDESPDYIQDNTFSGIDNYAIATLSLAGVKYNRQEIKEIKAAIGLDKKQKTIQDFGSKIISGQEQWVDFSSDFVNDLGGISPVVTVTPNTMGISLTVTEKSDKGFKVKVLGASNGDVAFDYIAMAKVAATENKEAKAEPISDEMMKGLKVDPAIKQQVFNWWQQEPARQKAREAKAFEDAKVIREQRKKELDQIGDPAKEALDKQKKYPAAPAIPVDKK